MTQRCGYVVLLGRPNAGKSTLLNALVGDKLAVVSRKPQTTRNRILGIALAGEAQLLFLDTPGMHSAERALINTTMNRVALGAAGEGDLLLYLVDGERGMTAEDTRYLQRALKLTEAPCLVVLSKIDAVRKELVAEAARKVEAALAEMAAAVDGVGARLVTTKPVLVSAKRPESVAALKALVAARLPEGPWLFPEDDLTDLPRNFFVAELIREQVFRQVGQEIPYGCAVKVDGVEVKPELVAIRALIVVARESHKPILIGKGGARVKAIGVAARESLARFFDQKVHLDLRVAVQEGWQDDARRLAELAHLRDLEELPRLREDGSLGAPV